MKYLKLAFWLMLVVSLAGAAAGRAADRPVSVIILLAEQPVQELAAEVGQPYQLQLSSLRAEARKLLEATRPEGVLLDVEQERAAGMRLSATESERLAEINAAADETLAAMRQAILAAAEPRLLQSQAPLVEAVRAAGGEVIYRYRLVNALAARLPNHAIAQLEARPEVAAVFPDQQIESDLNVSVAAIGANTWWSNGLDGGIWDVAVVDSGMDKTHPAFVGHTVVEGRFLAAAGNPATDPSPDDVNGHGTHVAGIIASVNGTYKGVANSTDVGKVVYNLKAGYDGDGIDDGPASMFWSDAMAAVDWAFGRPDDPDVLNLSYGACASSSGWPFERFWDAVVDELESSAAIAAGNSGFTCIHSPSVAYNVLSVANVYDNSTVVRGDDTIWSTSSRGPAPDGRRKPDIAAPGALIRSANNNWEGVNSDWVEYTGTSQAAPHVAGGLLLTLDGGLYDPREQKALLINTAEDRGAAGWDAEWGWGYLDLAHAYFHRLDVFDFALSPAPDFDLYVGPISPGDRATLVWNRHVDYVGANYPPSASTLNDLDLYLYNATSNLLVNSSIRVLDNVEQVDANATFTGVLRVQAVSSSFSGVSTERYALATEDGFQPAAGPSLAVTGGRSYFVETGQSVAVTVNVANSGDLTLHAVTASLALPAGVTLVGGTNPQALGNLPAGSSTPVSWVLQKSGPGVIYTVPVNVSGSGYGLGFSGQTAVNLVLPPTTFLPLINK